MQNKEERIFEPSLFKEYLKSKLISLLDSIAGKKLLMLEAAVRTPINLIVERKVISQHGVPDEGGIVTFEPIVIDKNYDQIVIMLSPTAENLKTLRQLILINIEKGNKKFYPVFWPKRTIASKQYLESQNLMQYLQVRDFSFDLLPIDVDLYSLEIKSIKDLYIHHDHSIYTIVAQSIHRLQCVFGKIHNIFYKGRASRGVYDILKLKQNQVKIDQNYGDIETLIILDRSIDFVTPLLRQMTYQGMIDEFFGINGIVTKIPSSLFEEAKEKKADTPYKNVGLSSEKDYIYQQIRILTVNGARSVLKARGAEFDRFVEQSKLLKDLNQKATATKRIQSERQYLKKRKKCNKIDLNLNAILMDEMKTIYFHKELLLQQKCILDKQKQLIQYFQNMIPFQIPLEKILRSMSLQAIIEKGVHKKIYPRICEDITLTYGVQQTITLTNLAKLGLFYESGTIKEPYPFTEIKKQLKLISQDPINHENPTNTSFAYGGYTPIMTRLVQGVLKGGWRTMQKALKMIPGQYGMPQVIQQCLSHPRPAVVVYFIGGVTYGQIATIRLLSRFLRKQIVIATTQLINGDTFMKSLIQKYQLT